MNDSKQAVEIQGEIAAVLLHDWDPIGVQQDAGAQDEYDSYVGGVYRLLAQGATSQAIAGHLAGIEMLEMGLEPSSMNTLLPVADKLRAIKVTLGAV